MGHTSFGEATFADVVKKFYTINATGSTLPRSQKPVNSPIAEPNEFIQQPHTLLLQDPF
jgi:hypothetical protein